MCSNANFLLILLFLFSSLTNRTQLGGAVALRQIFHAELVDEPLAKVDFARRARDYA